MKIEAKLLLDIHANLGEGPIWDEREQVLYWVDIIRGILHKFNPASHEDRPFSIRQPVGAVVLRESGGVMLALQDGFHAFDLETGQLTQIANPEAHLPGNRFNDGKCDPAGRFWAGTMPFSEDSPVGSLYRLDTDLTVHKMRDHITVSNGIVWTSDKKTMYYVDTVPRTITAFDYDNQTGAIQNARVVIQVPEEMGFPDGMAIDVEDKCWVAHWGGSSVRRWDPETGEVLAEIFLPTTKITAPAFGGRNLDTLFITSAGGDDPERLKTEPHAGGIFVAKPGVKGQPSFRFAG